MARGISHDISRHQDLRKLVKPAQFSYYRAGDVAEALELLTGFDGEAKLLAGGQSLVAMMNFRLARPPALIDITRIGGLNYLPARPDGLRLRAPAPPRAVGAHRGPAARGGAPARPGRAGRLRRAAALGALDRPLPDPGPRHLRRQHRARRRGVRMVPAHRAARRAHPAARLRR